MSKEIEQIKERLDIVEVIGGYIKISKAGKNYKARCPFHNEKTPSFSISPERQFFYCFGCQAKGDVFTFVERLEGLDFKGTLKILADKAGVKLENFNQEDKGKTGTLLEITEKATEIFQENLKQNGEALEYLKGRGINEESITLWRLGLAKNEWRDNHDKLISVGFKKEDLVSSGLVKKVENEEKYYDTFRGRIMFPIFDSSGSPIAFSGRILQDDGKSAKYINSPETLLFRKSEVLYGLNFAKGPIRKLDYAVLVEGQLDLVSSHQAGVTNTVASSGTALTDLHLKRLQKISNRIVFAYDGDEAGKKAGRRSSELALSLNMEVKIASLPVGEDPASVIKRSGEEWKSSLKDSVDVVEYYLGEVLRGDRGGINLAKKINKEIVPLISLVSNQIIKSQYVSLAGKRTGISESSIMAEVNKHANLPGNSHGVSESSIEPVSLTPEEILCGIILWQEDEDLKNKFTSLLGEKVFDEIVSNGNFDKETLMFEAERRVAGSDPVEAGRQILERLERAKLKKDFEYLARSLDKEKDEGRRREIRKEIAKVSDKLSKLSQ